MVESICSGPLMVKVLQFVTTFNKLQILRIKDDEIYLKSELYGEIKLESTKFTNNKMMYNAVIYDFYII